MGKLEMGVGLTVTFSINSLVHSNVELKTPEVFPPPHRNNQLTMLAVFICAHRDPPRFPDTTQSSTDANAKYCLRDRGRIVDATEPSVVLV